MLIFTCGTWVDFLGEMAIMQFKGKSYSVVKLILCFLLGVVTALVLWHVLLGGHPAR